MQLFKLVPQGTSKTEAYYLRPRFKAEAVKIAH